MLGPGHALRVGPHGPSISSRDALAEAAAAIRHLEVEHARGEIVVTVRAVAVVRAAPGRDPNGCWTTRAVVASSIHRSTVSTSAPAGISPAPPTA